MCGIIAVLSRRTDRSAPTTAEVVALLDTAAASVGSDPAEAATVLGSLDALLRGVPGVVAFKNDEHLVDIVTASLATIEAQVADLESEVEAGTRSDTDTIRLRDALWAISRDRIRTAVAVHALAGDATEESYNGYLAIQRALSALDRLEVRGRDSAGIQIMVSEHGLSAEDSTVASQLAERSHDELFRSASVREVQTANGSVLSFVYKAAAEIGELGDNTAVIRHAVQADPLLRSALSSSTANVVVLGHTRWASIGIISEANAHPLNSEELSGQGGPYVVGVLNGDVDNHADITRRFELDIHHQITTDAKVIPTLTSRKMSEGLEPQEAFRRAVNEFEGSVAIGAIAADRPRELMLALRGSGQGIYVGLAEDGYIVASEPYGVVEETPRYVRLDGEAGGEVLVLNLDGNDIDGLERCAYSGALLPVASEEVVTAEVTTRDIDRGDAPHYLLKEIEESPRSFRRTLRGRVNERDGVLEVALPEESMPTVVRERLASRKISRVRVIGQGTAAVAGQGVAAILHDLCDGELDVDAITATEVSGFQLRGDMSDTLIIVVSQSGTTTDTNRTVDLLRARGAIVIAIVNRRGSDLAVKSDGVVYTSDGRDVEMSVASTKAFYAQVAAGALLACDIASTADVGSQARRHRLLNSLQELPAAMTAVLGQRSGIADIATRTAPSKRYWAVVGNGPNLVAANEVRIKLSELCYK
ncbi:MAG: SIS domain-containing protein [Ilumatobacteraceae bacterium]